jgi:two-component system chemotaxis response regulator CheY
MPTSALIVDDEPHVRVYLRLLLVELGVRTFWEAGDGRTALTAVAEHSPELVVLDLNLPLLGGLDVLRQLTETRPEIPVIVVSSQTAASTVVECQRQGAVGYVLKHSPRNVALAALREALDGLGEGEEEGGESDDFR